MKQLIHTSAIALLSVLAYAPPAISEVVRGTGDPMSFEIGYGIQVNEGSSLLREWVIVNDDSFPVTISNFTSSTQVGDRNWQYQIGYEIDVKSNIQAVEVRFIPFNIWGDEDRALTTTEISDIDSGKHRFDAVWRILSETDAIEHYAMLAYVAQVKLSSGEIIQFNPNAVVEEAQRFSANFSSGDLSTEDE